MPNPEDCEHGFYQSRGCTKCAERGAEFIGRLRDMGVIGQRLPTFGKVKNPCPDCAGDICTMNCSSAVLVRDDYLCQLDSACECNDRTGNGEDPRCPYFKP